MLFFCLFQCFVEKEYQTESKRNETFRNVIFSTNKTRETWTLCQETDEESTRQGCAPTPWAHPPPHGPLWLNRPTSSSYIYPYTPKTSRSTTKPYSTAATFCTQEIPYWGLFRRFTGGGIDHGGLLHQHHSLSDEV